MCTVSFVPLQEGYILTSNRDESPNRKTFPPKTVTLKADLSVFAPVDAEKGGSWIATDAQGRTACLLNGGFTNHKRRLPYRKSRGHFVFEAFETLSFSHFIEDINLENIEPFTLILIDDKLKVLVWDGAQKHVQLLNNKQPHLWSSATLYTREQHQEKLEVFNGFLEDGNASPQALLQLHGLYQNNPFVLNREHVKTVSITQIVMKCGNSVLNYHLKKHKDDKINLLH